MSDELTPAEIHERLKEYSIEELRSLRTQLAESEKRGSEISATQCLHLDHFAGDEYGHSYCRWKQRAEAAEADAGVLREGFQDLRNRWTECQHEGEEFPVNTEHDRAVNEGVERVWNIVDEIAKELLSQPHPGADLLAKAKVKQMEEALEPFAKAANTFDESTKDEGPVIDLWNKEKYDPRNPTVRLTYGDFRKARAALPGGKGE